jgi:hypothetical protein
VTGNIRINGSGKLLHSSTGNSNMIPICYGTVSIAGVIQSGSGNFTVSQPLPGRYHIAITGEDYYYAQYTTAITPVSSTVPLIATTGSGTGNLQVYIHNLSGSMVSAPFNFVVYKQ